jgi:hypothetical protein
MIFPRYSLRVILVVTAICAVISLVLAQGLRGKPWAAGMSMGLLAVVVTLALGALAFAVIWAFTTVFARLAERREASHRVGRNADAARAGQATEPK